MWQDLDFLLGLFIVEIMKQNAVVSSSSACILIDVTVCIMLLERLF